MSTNSTQNQVSNHDRVPNSNSVINNVTGTKLTVAAANLLPPQNIVDLNNSSIKIQNSSSSVNISKPQTIAINQNNTGSFFINFLVFRNVIVMFVIFSCNKKIIKMSSFSYKLSQSNTEFNTAAKSFIVKF